MDINDLEKKLGIDGLSADEQMELVDALQKSAQTKLEIANQETIGKSTQVVIQGLKKIKSDLETRFSQLNATIESKASSLRDGKDGKDGKNGKDGLEGKQGLQGSNGQDGRDGRDGLDGTDGISVTSARIDFDGSLIIGLSSGVELNVGEVVAPDLAESIKVITNGGGTSQFVLDTLTSLQTQINNLIPSQTGNAGKFLTTNGTTISWSSVAGALSYQGTWNASTNTPTLTSSVGVNGYYYIVATAGSTNLNGITDWQIGDWLMFNGSVWQKIDQSNLVTSVNGQTGAVSVGTVTSVAATAGTGISITGSPITTSGTLNITNTAPDQTVVLTASTGISTSGTYPNFTITNSAPDQTVALTAGTGISTSGTYPNFTITNSAPDQTVALTGAGTTSITGTYPNFTITSNDSATGTVTSVGLSGGTTGLTVTGSPITTSGTITLGGTLDVDNGGTGQTSYTDGQLLIGNTTGNTLTKATLTAGSGIAITNGGGSISIAATNNGTVTSVTGTSPVASSGGATPAISLSSGYGDTLNPYASKTANYVLASPNGTAGVPTFRALVATDVPTLNQNTTGTASNVTGTVAIANGGTGTATPSLVAGTNITISGSFPNQTINASGGSGTVTSVAALTLGTTGTDLSSTVANSTTTPVITLNVPTASATNRGALSSADWTTFNNKGSGTVTSVTGTSPVASSGGATPAISLASGYGDTLNPYASKTANFVLAAPNGTAGVPTFRAVVAADIPTLNQNTTGSAGSLSATLAIASGGSGQTTAQLAMNAFAGAVTSGSYLRGNGTNVVMNTIQVADVPTLNQSTTGSAATLTTGRTIAITGDLAYTSPSFNGSANVTAAGTLATVNANVGSFTNATLTVNGKGLITAASSGTAPVTSVTATSPVASTGGTTPVISMPAATTSVSGYLTSTDWTTFNNKGSGTVTSVSGTAGRISSTGGATPVLDLASGIATAGTTGSASLIPVVTIDTYGRVTSITTAANPQGTVTSVTGTAPVVSSGGATPAISMAAATTSVSGYLTSTDWNTFNGKGSGTVTSVAATVPAFLSVSGSPITTTGTLAITLSGTALPVANGGTGVTTSTGSGNNVLSTSPTLTTPVLGTPTSGTLSNCTVDGTDAVGFRNVPVNSQSAAYTLVLADSGKTILHPSSDANARTFTIPSNASVAYPIGTVVTFINMTSQVVTIAINTDTMNLSPAGTTGSRSLAQYGSATALKITSTNWLISGSGLT